METSRNGVSLSFDLNARYGACTALKFSGGAAVPAVPALTAQLSNKDRWLRIQAAEALSKIGAPALSALPIMLEMCSKTPDTDDPRAMEQRYLCEASQETPKLISLK